MARMRSGGQRAGDMDFSDADTFSSDFTPTDEAGNVLSSGAMMSGNPYLMGASMGLKALSAASAARKKEFENKKAGQSKAFDAYTRALNMMA